MKYFFISLFIFSLNASDTGKRIYTGKGCYGCHGITGAGSGNYPVLANKNQNYLINKLISYKNGKIKTIGADVMNPFAQSLSEYDIKEVSKYLSNMKNSINEEAYEPDYEPWGGGGS